MATAYDLRSDTVTRPTPAMREAMARAEVGDDCYGDDPSVAALEQAVAARLGKDAAVFLPTGTMANQLAVRIHTRPGTSIATHTTAHVTVHEDGSAAALSGAQIMPIGGRRGYDLAALQALCREETCGWPPVTLVWLENTLGDAGGVPWPLHEALEPNVEGQHVIATWARAQGRAVHLDGARLWNAHIASGISLAELASVGDTVSVSMSKGLGAPMGSLLVGRGDLVERARGFKHATGGGMRQAGIVAAGGLHALEHHLERLGEDHQRAQRLAEAIADLPGWSVRTPATNMVLASVRPPIESAEELCGPLRAAGVLCHPNRYSEVRLVVHLGIDDDALAAIITRIRVTILEVVKRKNARLI